MHAGRRMMLGTIEEELAACRKRFEGVEVGAFVWCCHHEIELEVLTEPPEKRIDYIMHENSSIERARRLYEFRPVLGKLPAELGKARVEWNNASAEWDKAYDEWNKARAEWDKARAELAKAYDEYHVEIHALHVAEVPDTAWNGTSILGGSAAITGRKED